MGIGISCKTAVWILCGAIAFSALEGCAKHNTLFASRKQVNREDTTFAAGAGRSPTASTSYQFAKVLVSQGRDRDALYVLERAIRDYPKFLPAYNEAAAIYVRADRLDDAIAVLKRGLEKAPSDAVMHNNMGMCHLLKEDREKALDSFTRAVEAQPTNPTFRSNRAAALALVGRDKEAEQEYQTVLGKNKTRENLTVLARAKKTVEAGTLSQEPATEPRE